MAELIAGYPLEVEIVTRLMDWKLSDRPVPDERRKIVGSDGKVWEPFAGPWVIPPGESVMCDPPRFSRDIDAAWIIVEEMERIGWTVGLFTSPGEWGYFARFTRPLNYYLQRDFPIPSQLIRGECSASTWPLAICGAALNAIKAKP